MREPRAEQVGGDAVCARKVNVSVHAVAPVRRTRKGVRGNDKLALMVKVSVSRRRARAGIECATELRKRTGTTNRLKDERHTEERSMAARAKECAARQRRSAQRRVSTVGKERAARRESRAQVVRGVARARCVKKILTRGTRGCARSPPYGAKCVQSSIIWWQSFAGKRQRPPIGHVAVQGRYRQWRRDRMKKIQHE